MCYDPLMVMHADHYDFTAMIDAFLALKSFPEPNGDFLKTTMRQRAQHLLSHADVRYVPAFKLFDLLAELSNIADALAQEPHLRPNEALALFSSHSSDASPLIQQFRLEAALERARYEPLMMLDAEKTDAQAYRIRTLTARWHAMVHAHQSLSPLPSEWLGIVHATVSKAIAAPVFGDYRIGPLLQLFADMLEQARLLHESAASPRQLSKHIGESSALWKRYALKQARYRNDGGAPAGPAGSSLSSAARIPPISLPTKHSLH